MSKLDVKKTVSDFYVILSEICELEGETLNRDEFNLLKSDIISRVEIILTQNNHE